MMSIESLDVRESKTVPRHRLRIAGTGFHSCQWNLDSGFQSLVEFRIL